ncbi:unnamed protein product [Boreogadus saida]
MVARSRSVLQEQTVEVMEAVVWRSVAVVWRCSSCGPWRSSGGARREVRGGRLEALAAGGGKAGSRAAQRMLNEGLRRRSWRQRPAWRRRWPGGPGGVKPGRGGMEGQVAAPHPKGLEVEANLEGLKAVVETGLEAVAFIYLLFLCNFPLFIKCFIEVKKSGLYSQRLQQSGSGAGSCRWMVARSRSVLQEQTVAVMEAVVWRCSSGGPWRSSGGARREVRGGRLEALSADGGKAGSRAAQRMQNEGLRRRQRPAWRRRWPGGPGGVQPGRGGLEGQVAAPHPKGLEVEANLEGLEVEANLVGLEAAVGSNLEVLEAVVETGLEAERIVLPEASTERVWSWELQVDGGQEPFSPTGTDGGDGGCRLEVLVWRSVAVIWRLSLQKK